MPTPSTYVVKKGDTLNGIAKNLGYSDYKTAGISGFGADPNLIKEGQTLTIGAASQPRTSTIPGVGTVTVTPKNTAPAPVSTDPVGENAAGMYARTGITPPTPTTTPTTPTSTGYTPPTVAGLPTYAKGTSQAGVMDAYNATLKTISDIEARIKSGSVPSDEEVSLQKQLDKANAKLNEFDVGTLQAEEALRGQGRGATLGTIDTRTTVLDRTRALERLGFATEANTIATQLSTAKNERNALGDLAKTEYDLTTKRLDIALGVQSSIDKLNNDDKDEARQYLLDVVNFADGKSYDALDAETQAAITSAVANSPITLGMVQTALQSGADKAAAAANGELRSVAGVGVVQVKPDGSYKVIIPEQPADHSSPSADVPSFNEYLADQNLPLPSLTPDRVAALKAEYNARYASGNGVSLGKLNATNKNDLAQAGLSSAPTAVQSYFLNSPAGFRDQYQRDRASGKVKPAATVAEINAAYAEWYAANNKSGSGSGTDWNKVFSGQQ